MSAFNGGVWGGGGPRVSLGTLLWERPNKGVMRSFLGSVDRQRPISKNRAVFSMGYVLRTSCRGNIVLLVQAELQKRGAGWSRHA
jgi:hypothetical protein